MLPFTCTRTTANIYAEFEVCIAFHSGFVTPVQPVINTHYFSVRNLEISRPLRLLFNYSSLVAGSCFQSYVMSAECSLLDGYLRQGGYVFIGVNLFVSLFIYLFVC